MSRKEPGTMMTTTPYLEKNYCSKPVTISLPSKSFQSGRPLPVSPSYQSSAEKFILSLAGQSTKSDHNCPILTAPGSSALVRTSSRGRNHSTHPGDSFTSTSHTYTLTMATTGPECMYFTRPAKNGRSFRSM